MQRGHIVTVFMAIATIVACSSQATEDEPAKVANVSTSKESGLVLSTEKLVYGPREEIRISFSNAPGNNPVDWIGIYTAGEGPQVGSLAWQYVVGGQEETTGPAPAAGTITIGESSVREVTWPFPAGKYTAFYLLNDQYTSIGSLDFEITCPVESEGCAAAKKLPSSGGGSGGSSGGCTHDSSCGRCKRCERSTGRCLTRVSC